MDVDASPETDRKLKLKPEPLEMEGDEHFKLACNYRMMRVANGESYVLHKRGAMTKARRVSAYLIVTDRPGCPSLLTDVDVVPFVVLVCLDKLLDECGDAAFFTFLTS